MHFAEQVQQEVVSAVKQAGPHPHLFELKNVGKDFPYALQNEPAKKSGFPGVLQVTEF